ncbi:hypothetical protein JKP88DRAFT_351840 [Tribonema minus]|uniref:IPT/TIG domain-containing protein n=1 Tax=Tribonema minus TaxID=303371 RepID=A0A835ZGA4_9STRA|nr:hypothetical protein JKP88DRAFT_351840 [Tribonema minus]
MDGGDELAKSAPVAATSPTQLACEMPLWKFFAGDVLLYVAAQGVEVGGGDNRLPFTIWEGWLNAAPTNADPAGGSPILVTGAGFDPNAQYFCLWTTGADKDQSALVNPINSGSLSCLSPLWAFDAEQRNIQLQLFHFDPDTGANVEVPLKGPPFFFSFSAGAAVWTSLVVTPGDPGYPNGRGVAGGDVVTFTGNAFNAAKPGLYSCLFTIGIEQATVAPLAVTATHVRCITPGTFTVGGLGLVTLQYGAPPNPLGVKPALGATVTIYGQIQAVNRAIAVVALPLPAVFTDVEVLGGVLTAEGGTPVTVTGRGLNPALGYTCSWVGSAGNTVVTAAGAPNAVGTELTCTTPVIAKAAPQAYQLTIVGTADGQLGAVNAAVAAVQTVFTLGNAWVSKDVAAGSASGGTVVTVTGVNLAGNYQCLFGTAVVNAFDVSAQALTCITPLNYGTTNAAATVKFSVRQTSTAVEVPYGGSGVVAEDQTTFRFVEDWTSVTPPTGPVYSAVVTTLLLQGQGFVATRIYTCAFVKPECKRKLQLDDADADAAGTPLWDRPVAANCYVSSPPAIVLGETALRCTLPTWPYPAAATALAVLGSDAAADGAQFRLARPLRGGSADTFYFNGVTSAAVPAASDVYGGFAVEVAALGVDLTATDYMLQWQSAAAAGAANVAVADADLTSYSAIITAKPGACTRVKGPAAAVASACVSATMPIWPHSAGAAQVSLLRVSDAIASTAAIALRYTPAPFTFVRATPSHYRIVADLLLGGPSPSDINLPAITELRYLLAEKTRLDVTACQRRAAAAAAAAAAPPTVSVRVVLATQTVDSYAGGLAGARAAADGIARSLTQLGNQIALGTLAGARMQAALTVGDPEITLVASECPPGTGQVNAAQAFAADAQLSCLECEDGSFGAGGGVCEPCPTGSVCLKGSSLPYAQPGYWRNPIALVSKPYSYDAYPFHQCLAYEACLGGPNSACASGSLYGSNLCAVCEDGYAEGTRGGTCDTCGSDSRVRARFSVFAAVVLGVLAVLLGSFLRTRHVSAQTALERHPSLAGALAPSAASAAADSATDFAAVNSAAEAGAAARHASNKYQFQPADPKVVGSDGLTRQPVRRARRRSLTTKRHAAAAVASAAAVAAEVAADDDGVEIGGSSGSGGSGGGGAASVRDEESQYMSNVSESSLGLSPNTTAKVQQQIAMGGLYDSPSASSADYSANPLTPHSPAVARTQALERMAQTSRLQALGLVAIGYVQALTALAFGAVYWVRWPQGLAGLLTVLGIMDLSVLTLPGLSLRCLFPGLDFYTEWTFAVLFLPAVALLLAAAHAAGARVMARRHGGSSGGDAQSLELQQLRFRAKCVQAFVWAALAVYAGVSRRVFQLFNCRTLDNGQRWLWADMTLQCSGSTYNTYLGFNVIALLIYPLGVPLALLLCLRRARAGARLLGPLYARWTLPFSFLSAPYRGALWWWEIADLVRRALLTGVLVYVLPHAPGQLGVGFALTLACLAAHAVLRPHVSPIASALHRAGLVCVALTTMCGLIIQSSDTGAGGSETAVLGGFALAFNVIWIALLLPLAALACLSRVRARFFARMGLWNLYSPSSQPPPGSGGLKKGASGQRSTPDSDDASAAAPPASARSQRFGSDFYTSHRTHRLDTGGASSAAGSSPYLSVSPALPESPWTWEPPPATLLGSPYKGTVTPRTGRNNGGGGSDDGEEGVPTPLTGGAKTAPLSTRSGKSRGDLSWTAESLGLSDSDEEGESESIESESDVTGLGGTSIGTRLARLSSQQSDSSMGISSRGGTSGGGPATPSSLGGQWAVTPRGLTPLDIATPSVRSTATSGYVSPVLSSAAASWVSTPGAGAKLGVQTSELSVDDNKSDLNG